MPIVPALLATHAEKLAASRSNNGDDAVDWPEFQPLFLPHALDIEQLDGCAPGLADMESRLRDGQLRASLDNLRLHLHIKARQLKFKAKNSRHQIPNTRARTKIDANEAKVSAAAEKYRIAWRAKKALCGLGPWSQEWCELKQSDVRRLEDDDGVDGASLRPSAGKRTVSWIWMGADNEGNPKGLTECTFLS